MTAPLCVIRVAGDPIGKGRPRARIVRTRAGGEFISLYTPVETRAFEARIRAAAIDAMRGCAILDGDLSVLVFAYFQIPESWSIKKQEAARAGLIRPTSRPDADNLLKLIDGLNPFADKRTKIKVPIVWRDDAQVVDARVVKIYARTQTGIIIEIRQAAPPPIPWRSTKVD